ncbi:MAG TPA: hypothetical protein VKE70_09580 [Candidatus Solibacter sp.]|nr:hypothetical protein [Candidatus Solibacter sp.]
MTKRRNASVNVIVGILASLLLAAVAGCNGSSSGRQPGPQPTAFVPNRFSFWNNPAHFPTTFGPAYANITTTSTNFLPCRGGPYALCYYSGPTPETCTIAKDNRFADCECFEIPYGVYFVDINAILNWDVYQQTVSQCQGDGSACQTTNSAPVCAVINQNALIPGAELNSTFSFDCIPTNGLGQTDCTTAPYAGCMTAPCFRTGAHDGLVTCQCPIFDGPYQIGQTLPADQCTLGDSLVWSAALAPPSTTPAASTTPGAATHIAAKTFPEPPGCVPDAPGSVGCPLFDPGHTVLPPDSHVDCSKVCEEYGSCRQNAIQAGFTCDATLCTDECNDRDLVKTACTGLTGCDISEIVKAEEAADCSCCASQLCGCAPDQKTNTEIAVLNQQQRDRGITPQCDINGTLCGSPP